MAHDHKFNLLTLGTLSCLAVAIAVAPASALPGQNVNTVIKWTKTKPQLPTLRYTVEEQAYSGKKGNLYYFVDVTSKQGTVRREGMTVSGDSSLKFTTKNAKAVKLIQNIYNSNIANDFSQSTLSLKTNGEHYYQGKKYGYVVAELESGSTFQLLTLKQSQQEINRIKYCQTHHCDL